MSEQLILSPVSEQIMLPLGVDEDDEIFLGRAVENGRLRFSSVSQIVLFDPEHEGCNRKWAFHYLFGKRPRKTDAQTRGAEYAAKLEHYLKTGEDVLPPIFDEARKFLPVPGPDLEVEEPLAPPGPNQNGLMVPGGAILRAIALREEYLRDPSAPGAFATLAAIKQNAGLVAAGVPLKGAADFRHRRGEYLDEGGDLAREPASAVVAEIGDLKTISRIDPVTIKSGENAGKTLPGLAKTPAQVCAHPQMVGYGVHAADKWPDLTHLRLSHVYAQTKGKKAVKRTGLITVAEVRRRWLRVEDVVREMEKTAGAAKPEDVPPNLAACDAFTHVDAEGKTQKGCPHRTYCPLSDFVISQNLLGPIKETAMSLFDTPPPPPPAPPPPNGAPPLSDAGYNAAVEAEKAKLLGLVAPPPPPTAATGCGAPGCGDGCAPGWRKGETSGGFIRCAHCKLADAPSAAIVAVPPPPPAPVGAAVVPPDAPTSQPLDRAAPLPQSEIDKITDPVLRQLVEEHSQKHAASAAADAQRQAAEGQTIWCPGGGQRLEINVDLAIARKMTCTCGKEIKLKPAKESDKWFATLPRHKLKEETPTQTQVAPPQVAPAGAQLALPAPPPPPPPVTVAPTVVLATQAVLPPPPPTPVAQPMAPSAHALGVFAELAAGCRAAAAWLSAFADRVERGL